MSNFAATCRAREVLILDDSSFHLRFSWVRVPVSPPLAACLEGVKSLERTMNNECYVTFARVMSIAQRADGVAPKAGSGRAIDHHPADQASLHALA